MKKYLSLIPPVFFLTVYLLSVLTGVQLVLSTFLVWFACYLVAAVLFHKGIAWGSVFGILPSLQMIYEGGLETLIGIALVLFYACLGIYLWKKRDADTPPSSSMEFLLFFSKIMLTVLSLFVSSYAAVFGGLLFMSAGIHLAFVCIGSLVMPALLLPLIWLKKRKRFLII